VFLCVQSCSCELHYAQLLGLVKAFCLKNCASSDLSPLSAGERLREERSRLGLNQEEFAQLGGVNRNTQGSYEKNERTPDLNYLSAISVHGVDVLFVVTGVRLLAAAGSLSPMETSLLEAFRTLTESDQDTLTRMAAGLSALSKTT